MLRLFSSIKKELLILSRDKGGLAVMFLMPMALITIMALIQDAPFKDYQEIKIDLLLVNNDTSFFGKKIENELLDSKIFVINKFTITNAEVKQKIKEGDFEVGIIIPSNATKLLNAKVNSFVNKNLASFGLVDSSKSVYSQLIQDLSLQILFAQSTKKSFKISILSSLKQSISKMETQILVNCFNKKLNSLDSNSNQKVTLPDFVNLKEIQTVETPQEALKLNSVQHNVPAWTIFGMFFIVISMAGGIIKERDDGSYTRLLTTPGSYFIIVSGKVAAYLLVCLIQCFLMLVVGFFFLPFLGLPQLIIGSSIAGIFFVAIFTAFASTGYGILVGAMFKTHQQASTFGAVSIVILAALGGIWVPVYVMPQSMKILAEFSPLFWSLKGFNKLFLSDGNLTSILPQVIKLFAFFVSTICIALFINKSRRG